MVFSDFPDTTRLRKFQHEQPAANTQTYRGKGR